MLVLVCMVVQLFFSVCLKLMVLFCRGRLKSPLSQKTKTMSGVGGQMCLLAEQVIYMFFFIYCTACIPGTVEWVPLANCLTLR